MILFEKETKVVTFEKVEVPNGIYYFSYITNDKPNAYYKIAINDNSFDKTVVVLDDEETSLRVTVNIWDVDYYVKRLFQGDDGVMVITKDHFNLKMNEAIKIISNQL